MDTWLTAYLSSSALKIRLKLYFQPSFQLAQVFLGSHGGVDSYNGERRLIQKNNIHVSSLLFWTAQDLQLCEDQYFYLRASYICH